MKKFIVPTAIALLAATLSGCGDDEDSIYGLASSNELAITQFDKGIDRQTGREAIARIETEYSDGERDIDVTNIVGNFNTQNIDDLDNAIVLADNFEGTLEDRYIEVNGRTIKRPIYEKNNNNTFNYQTVYRTLNLAGVNIFSYQAGTNANNSRGVFTALNNYPSIANNAPNNIVYPDGSVCYIPVTTSDRSFFVFNNKDKTSYSELDDWIEATERLFNDNRGSRTSELKIGANNNNPAAQVKFFATSSDPEYLYNGVEYNSAIYNTDFVDKNASRPNEDSFRGVVDCSLVNEVAADFIETQIRRYY